MKSATFDRVSAQVNAALWRLTLTCWVGGLVVACAVFVPVLIRIGMPSLLVDDVVRSLTPSLMWLALVGVSIQLLLLVQVGYLASVWRDARGHLLLLALLLIGGYFGTLAWLPKAAQLQLFCYMAVTGCGIGLAVSSVPGPERKVRH